MLVVLTGGDCGGQEVEWPEGESHITLDGCVYRFANEQGVYVGTVENIE